MRRPASTLCAAALAIACHGPTLEPWHTVKLKREFKARDANEIRDLARYLSREAELFAELDEKVHGRTESGPAQLIERFSTGSLSDPREHAPNCTGDAAQSTHITLMGDAWIPPYRSRSPHSELNVPRTMTIVRHRRPQSPVSEFCVSRPAAGPPNRRLAETRTHRTHDG